MTRNCTKSKLVIFGRESRKLAKKDRLSHRLSPSPPTNFIGTAGICNRKLHHAFKPIQNTSPLLQTMLSGRAFAQAARSAAPRAPIAPRVAFRCYAQAASSASTKPPVALFGIDGTYASALVRIFRPHFENGDGNWHSRTWAETQLQHAELTVLSSPTYSTRPLRRQLRSSLPLGRWRTYSVCSRGTRS